MFNHPINESKDHERHRLCQWLRQQSLGGTEHTRTNHQAKMSAKVDTDDNGSVNQAELSTLLDKVSEKTGASFGDAAKGGSPSALA